MRKFVVVIACLAAFYMDSILFPLTGIRTFAPEALLALAVSLGVLAGAGTAVWIAALTGALLDILFNKIFGLSALFYVGAALAGGMFYNKFYADNIIIPGVTAAAVMFVKENVMYLIVRLSGGRVESFVMTLLTHTLPSALLTGALCMLFHLILRRVLYRPHARRDIDNR